MFSGPDTLEEIGLAARRRIHKYITVAKMKEALIKFRMRDRGDSGRGQDGEDAV
jgi:hypothetical protein